jgi:hypothetical protein
MEMSQALFINEVFSVIHQGYLRQPVQADIQYRPHIKFDDLSPYILCDDCVERILKFNASGVIPL